MRINVIPVTNLSDAHLMAELRELPMSIHYFKRSKASKRGINWNNVPLNYTLSTGHAMFFYNKFNYILERYIELLKENKRRGFKTEAIESLFLPLFNEHVNKEVQNDYEVTKKDIYINVERILTRIYEMIFIKNKPNFYKLNGQVLSFLEWTIYYTEHLDLDTEEVYLLIKAIESEKKLWSK